MSLNDNAVDAQDLIVDDLQPADDRDAAAPALPPMVFVFGSNEIGKHGGGAARAALDNYGAIYGQGFGYQGNSFAIPTVSTPRVKITEAQLRFYVECFLLFAAHHPELTFQVTQLGCGLAGWSAAEVAPLFVGASKNCQFDTAWEPFLGSDVTYWGTF
jgi:hypothetical protein